jgi:hypothetical protein
MWLDSSGFAAALAREEAHKQQLTRRFSEGGCGIFAGDLDLLIANLPSAETTLRRATLEAA